MAQESGETVLDVASGTGDIPVRLLARMRRTGAGPCTIVVSDISGPMLAKARLKLGDEPCASVRVLDAHQLDVPDTSVDLYSISFGMKICDRSRVVAEALRVLRSGGVFYCLEAARIPFEPLHQLYLAYMDWCLPLIGRIAADGDASAYGYLLRGVHAFPAPRAFAAELVQAGFADVTWETMSLGIVAIHRGVKP
jgi:ubiquinone/menaquinone biosynthesis methyltransferase